jgi:hypothetical protein
MPGFNEMLFTSANSSLNMGYRQILLLFKRFRMIKRGKARGLLFRTNFATITIE